MSFFKKKPKPETSPPNTKADFPPPLIQPAAGFGSPNSQNSLRSNPSAAANISNGLPPGAGLLSDSNSSSHTLQQQMAHQTSARPPQPPSSTEANRRPSNAPAANTNVVYPWSQKALHYLPISLAPPTPPEFQDPNSHRSSTLREGPSPAPFPRYGHSVSSVANGPSGDLYIFGGLVDDRACNDLYVLHATPNSAAAVQAARDRGDKLVPAPGSVNVGLIETKGEVPSPRLGHASVGVGNVLIVWGGDTNSAEDAQEPNDNALYLLNLSSRDWTRVKIEGPAPEGRYGHAVAMVGSCFYVFGGQNSGTSFLNDMWSFDLQKLKAGNAQWVHISPSSAAPNPSQPMPSQRTGHTIVTHKDNLYVFGGTDGQYHYNDTWEYSTQTGRWTELSCSGYIPVAREGHAATLVDDVMYVFAGRGVDGKDLEDLAAFKITGAENVARRWFMFQHMGPTPSGRSGHAMATWQAKVFVLGGESYSNTQPGYDPNFVHCLDTSKIKYPQPKPGSAPQLQQAAQRKPSLQSSQTPSLQNLQANIPPQQQQQQQAQAPAAQRETQEELKTRAASPPLVQVGRGPNNARSHSFIESQSQPLAFANNNGRSQSVAEMGAPAQAALQSLGQNAPVRPRREDETLQPRAALGGQPLKKESLQDMRAPQAARDRAPSPQLLAPQPSPLPYPTQQQQQHPLILPQSAAQAPMSAPVQVQAAAVGPAPVPAASAAAPAQYAQPQQLELNQQRNPLAVSTVSQSSVRTEKAVQWMLAALATASTKGFLLPSDASAEDLSRFADSAAPSDKDKKVLVQALLSVKQELAKAKASMASHSTAADERVHAANAARAAAVQEAAYYKAKLTALEACSPDANKIDRERIHDLEARLSQALTERKAAQKELSQLTTELTQERELKEGALERAASASSRIEATETSYSRSLSDYAELQRRIHSHESSIQDHLNTIAQLTSQHATIAADHAHTKSLLETSEESCSQYLKTLEQTHVAFSAANTQATEMMQQANNAKEELLAEKQRVSELEVELKHKAAECEHLVTKSAELERSLEATRAEHAAMHALTNDGLSQLLSTSKDAAKTRETDLLALHEAKIRALSDERDSLRSLHADATSRSTALTTDLSDASARATALEKAQLGLRAELSILRSQRDTSLQEMAKLKSELAVRDIQLSEQSRAAEASETKSALLRSLMADHGISQEDSVDGSPSLGSANGHNVEQLVRRVHELESQLESRTRSQKNLEAAHDESRKGLELAEQQLRDISRQHQESEGHVDALRHELDRARSPTSSVGHGADDSRSIKAEQELAVLQEKHKSLADAHSKAVQYVKGTEKMLRRMKDEVNKHKGRADELETQLAQAEEGSGNSQLREDLDGMRVQLKELLSQSQEASSHNKELQHRLTTVSSEYEAQLKSHKAEASARIADLEEEVQHLHDALMKAQHELEDSLSLNSQLNSELASALKRPGSRSGHSKTASFSSLIGTSEAEVEVKRQKERIEWLEDENKNLTKRYQLAEQRVAVLLETMERGVASETSSLAGGADSHSRSSRISAELERLALASGHTRGKGLRDSFSDSGRRSTDSEELRHEFFNNQQEAARGGSLYS